MKDKVFIITGASGIAAETIKIAASKGARVFYISEFADQCETLSGEIEKEGAQADYLVGDLTDPETAPRLVAACANKYGRIDGLYNVAGSSGRKFGDGPLHECTEEGWAKTLSINLTTQYRMCREAVRRMLTQAPDECGLRGTVLNMSSILGVSPEPQYFSTIAYATAKGAIISMSKSMASCYARQKIRVNAIAPALVQTQMSERASTNEEIVDFMAKKQPLKGTMMTAREVAEASLFLLSAESRVITGEILRVDAGWSISG
jgi:NAD(P)-dependent dehydrogenase (short-subunit alcohol dehydrogenase family)